MLFPIFGLLFLIIILIFVTRGKNPPESDDAAATARQNQENNKELRQKVDLHYGRRDFSGNKNYVEFSFLAPFGEVFSIDWLDANPQIDGTEIFRILNILQIGCDREFILDRYELNNSTEVFHSTADEQVFAYFDLHKDPTDSMGMFFLGISCKREDEKITMELLLDIYRKLQTSSAFNFDILNHPLYNKTFRSYFYFYEDSYDENKPQLNHHFI